jgi:signal transduction histidine kinase
VINLLINAIQAMPKGGVLRLNTHDLPDGVAVTVQDSGSGLTPAVLERLFRPFFTTKNDGNGLGLWISVGLVERYGGSLLARNRSDGATGALFTLSLLSEPQAPAATSTQDGRPGAQLG